MKHINKIAALALLLAGSATAGAVSVTFHVSDADAVSMAYNGTTTTLQAGDNTFDLNEYDYLTFQGITPWVITSVTNSAGTPESLYSGTWYKSVYSTDNGQVYNITAKNLEEARSASCTVNVDDPSQVSAVLSGTYSNVSLNAGENTLKFDPETETTLMVSSSNYQKPLYKVTLNGTDVTSQGGTYNVPLSQGCQIDIVAKIPEVPVTVNFTYSEEGEGAISSVAVNNQPVGDFNGKTLSMTAGQSLTLNPNSAYNITGLKVNGESQYWTGGYAYNIYSVTSDTEIYVEAHPYKTVKVTVNVTDPAQVKVYRGYSYSNDRVYLSGTSNQVELPENNTILSWAAADGCYIESVKVNGEAYTNDNVTCTEGMTIDIATKEIVMDKKAAVWIDDRSLIDQYFSFESSTRVQLGNSFTSGYNVIDFYSAYSPFMLSWYTSKQVVGKVYVNDELKSPMYDGGSSYELALDDNDVVKIFYAKDPENCTVTFTVADGLDPKVTHDVICEIDELSEPLSCFAGTRIDVAKGTKDFDVKVNGEKIVPQTDSEAYTFTVTDPQTQVDIVEATFSGIDGIADGQVVASPVYNLQGVKVSDTLQDLPAGIYISAGKKVLVK